MPGFVFCASFVSLEIFLEARFLGIAPFEPAFERALMAPIRAVLPVATGALVWMAVIAALTAVFVALLLIVFIACRFRFCLARFADCFVFAM